MARELYNWDQNIGYLIVAIDNYNRKHKYNKIDTDEFLKEYNPLQTQYGKEGIIGFANRIKNKNK